MTSARLLKDQGSAAEAAANGALGAGKTAGVLSRRNEFIYIVFKVLTLAIFDRAIFVIFLLHKGFSPYQIGILQSIFFLANIITEVPAGMFGDAVGRKWSVLLGLVAYCLYAAGAMVSNGFPMFVGLYALLGLALSLVYGSDTALIYDSLVMDQRADDFNRIQLKANALGLISGAFAVLIGGALQKLSWNAVYGAYFAINAIALVVWCFAHEPPEASHGRVKKEVLKELGAFIKHDWRRVALPILGVTAFAACTSPFYTFSQALFNGNGFTVQHITWFYFAAQMSIGLVYLLMQRSMSFLGFYPVVMVSTLLTAVMLALMVFNIIALDFTCFLMVMIINPIVGVVSNNLFNSRLPNHIRASFLSIIGLCMSLSISVVYFLYGYLAQYMAIYQVMALTSVVSLLAFAIFWLARRVDAASPNHLAFESRQEIEQC